jgi:multidrug resistance efflux pump
MSLKIFSAAILSILITISFYYSGNVDTFMGVAESNESLVTFPNATQVLQVKVSPGQKVKKEDTLAVLSRPELIQEISQIKRQLDELKGKTNLTSTDINSQVLQLRSNLSLRSNEIKLRIKQLENQLTQNISIQNQFGNNTTKIDSSSGIPLEIKNLKHQLQTEKSSTKKQIGLLHGSDGKMKGSGKLIRESLEAELNRLQKEEKEFALLAPSEGIINEVFSGANQNLAAFAPLLSINALTPNNIRAYIPEQVKLDLKKDDEVKLKPFAYSGKSFKGKITGLGSRIVEIPVSLRKYPDLITYGREILIKINPNNPLLLNEKVRVEAK